MSLLLLRGWPKCQHLDQLGSEIRFQTRFLVLLESGRPGNEDADREAPRFMGVKLISVLKDPACLPVKDKSLDASSTRWSIHRVSPSSLDHGKEKPHCGKHAKPVPRSASADLRDRISKYNAYPATMGLSGTDCICEDPCLGWRESNVGLNAFAAADRRVPSGSFYGSILPAFVG